MIASLKNEIPLLIWPIECACEKESQFIFLLTYFLIKKKCECYFKYQTTWLNQGRVSFGWSFGSKLASLVKQRLILWHFDQLLVCSLDQIKSLITLETIVLYKTLFPLFLLWKRKQNRCLCLYWSVLGEWFDNQLMSKLCCISV